jgi:hypothetical protein
MPGFDLWGQSSDPYKFPISLRCQTLPAPRAKTAGTNVSIALMGSGGQFDFRIFAVRAAQLFVMCRLDVTQVCFSEVEPRRKAVSINISSMALFGWILPTAVR